MLVNDVAGVVPREPRIFSTSVVKKQAEMFNERVQEMRAEVQKASAGNPVEGLSQRGEFVQQTFQKIFEDMRELAEMAQKSQSETLAAISQRAAKDGRESKTALKHK
ncbi:TIGR01841 family phasin [Paraburkholderia phenazinium]|uniref:TIGR01841 family phasin n=1 Tax=Paraburkholderia phenazinium TaxID=60549 RepID=UPI0015899AEF|nr:TIGR01841 family phasin [Paraburkholderia phenazinium]